MSARPAAPRRTMVTYRMRLRLARISSAMLRERTRAGLEPGRKEGRSGRSWLSGSRSFDAQPRRLLQFTWA